MHARLLALLVLGATLTTSAFCDNHDKTVYSLVAPTDGVTPGRPVEIQLAVLNPSPVETSVSLPPTLTARLVGMQKHWKVEVRSGLAAGNHAIAPGGFALVPLAFTLPAKAAGQLVFELDQPVPLRLVLPAAVQPVSPVPEEMSASRAPASMIEQRTAGKRLRNYFADNFAPYEPIYFLYGSQAPAAKFQVSFKYRLPLDDGWLVHKLPQMRGLHLAFTQRSLWDIRGESSPFYDSSYMPELLYQFAAREPDLSGTLTWLGWSGGVQHESNGKNGADSRSMNIAYARTAFALGDLDDWYLLVMPRARTYVGDRFDNPNIADYRGWGDLWLILGRNDGPALSLYGRIGRGFRHGAFQADLTVPTSAFSGSWASYLHIQYWSGYGESLLRYDRRTDSVRAGFSLLR
ncbi:MAG: phospholipase A [Opitutaceae bacterium]|nr:phospholipase A [Opitutaceae bacterium]